jgi:hypothetical protein
MATRARALDVDKELENLYRQVAELAADIAALIRVWEGRTSVRSKAETHKKLMLITKQLRAQHAALALDKRPFSQTEHDAHNVRLRQHRKDLVSQRLQPEAGANASRTRRRKLRR